MKSIKSISIILFLLQFGFCDIYSQLKNPPRLPRKDCFFGVHFDFHANTGDKQIGKDLTPEMINRFIDEVKPDFIQIDCKGHPGYSSYPTKVGNPAPGFIKDPLRIWRDATAARGVALYIHYSGIIDERAIEKHPGWAIKNSDNKTDRRITSVFGAYADSLLIPQLKEIITEYDVDGAWVDGECWAVKPDYSEKGITGFKNATGINSVPGNPDEPFWNEFLEFNRAGFRKYIQHYTNELHKLKPDFYLTSALSFSSQMPEPDTIGLDYLSGDMSELNSIDRQRLETRCYAQQTKPWDAMTWGFTWRSGSEGFGTPRTAIQIKQEAAIVLSQGGGFQVYYPEKRDASIYQWPIPILKEVGKFCRERQAVCHNSRPVPQIGLVLSEDAFYKRINRMFAYDMDWKSFGSMGFFYGILLNLIQSQQVVDVVMDFNLDQKALKYPLLIYPEWNSISECLKKKLLAYVTNGGNLLVIGPKNAKLFENELGISLLGQPEIENNALLYNGFYGNIYSVSQQVKLSDGAIPFGTYNKKNWENKEGLNIAASITPYGKGRIAGVYLELGERYTQAATPVSRDFLAAIIKELFPNPTVEVQGSHYVDVTLNRVNGKLAINLINTLSPQGNNDILTYDEIPPLGPLKITIRTSVRPGRLVLQPENKELPFEYKDGKISTTLSKLEIHEILLVE